MSRPIPMHRPRPTILLALACLSVAAWMPGGCGSTEAGRDRAAGNSAFARGDYEAAAERYRASVRRNPGDAEAHYMLGRALAERGEHGQARESFAMASGLEPDNATYVEARADHLVRIDRIDEMYRFLSERAESRQTVEDYLRLGRYAERSGLDDEAESAYLASVTVKASRDLRPHLTLAEFYRRLGDVEAELAQLEAIIRIDRDHPAATARLRELRQVPGPTFRSTAPSGSGG